MSQKPFFQHVESFRRILRKKGAYSALKATIWYFWFKRGFVQISPFERRRLELSDQIDRMFNSTVGYGPFKGLKFPQEDWWAKTDRASMILGLYEEELLSALTQIPSTHRTFVNLGAADGYYSLGVLVSGLFDRAHCFELSETGREILASNAALNGVSDSITIYGAAEKDFYRLLPANVLSKSVLFVDIEGSEFDLLTAEVFRAFRGSFIFVECHEGIFPDGAAKLLRLKQRAADNFRISELTTTSRDLSRFPELKTFSDTDRWLICDEGRPYMMTWLRLEPKE